MSKFHHVIGEIYIVPIHKFVSHTKKGDKTAFNVRAICIGHNDVGNIGYFADTKGNVFHESCYEFDMLKNQTYQKEIVDIYPFDYGIWRTIDLKELDRLNKDFI